MPADSRPEAGPASGGVTAPAVRAPPGTPGVPQVTREGGPGRGEPPCSEGRAPALAQGGGTGSASPRSAVCLPSDKRGGGAGQRLPAGTGEPALSLAGGNQRGAAEGTEGEMRLT